MPTDALTKSALDREIGELVRLKQKVNDLLRPAVEAYLTFAQRYRDLHERVDRDRRDDLRSRLGINDYQHQRLMAIAQTSKTLLSLKRALPPAIEPLYEVARIARRDDGETTLRAAVDAKRLTPTAGIREIRAIRTGVKRRKMPQRDPAATVSIEVTDCDEDRLASLIAGLLEEDAGVSVACNSQSLVDATKAAVIRRYEQRASGNGSPIPRIPDVTWNVQAAHEQLEKGTKPSGTKADDVTKNAKHPYHTATVPDPELAARLKAEAEQRCWLVPEIGLGYGHYAPELTQRQERISKR